MNTYSKSLEDGTKVTIEDEPGTTYIRIRIQKGRVTRSFGIRRNEAEVLRELLFRLPKPEVT